MKIAVVVLITILVIGRLSIGVIGCNKNGEDVNTSANKGQTNMETIANGNITFNRNKKIGSGTKSIVYSGTTMDGTKVAVKVMNVDKFAFQRYELEREAYEYLGAINGEECKIYGIAHVIYAGNATDTKVLVLPEFEFNLNSPKLEKCSEENYLKIMQDLTITLKFIHSKGVVQRDFNMGNIMFLLNQVFLIDFTNAGIHKKGARSINDMSLTVPGDESKDMLEMFLLICEFFKISEYMRTNQKTLGRIVCNKIEDITNNIISRKVMKTKYVKPLVKFSCEVFEAVEVIRLPNYNKLYEILDEALYPGGNHNQPVVFDWLSKKQKAAARNVPIVSIKSIEFPSAS